MDAAGVHDRGDREHDECGEDALGGAGDDLRDGDEPHRARRLHAVLDLAGEPELLRQGHGHRLDALEHDRDADDAGDEHGGERRLAGTSAAAADALTDRREHVEEHEHEQERLHERAGDELAEVLAQHDEVALDQRDERGAAGLGDRPDLGGDVAVSDACATVRRRGLRRS